MPTSTSKKIEKFSENLRTIGKLADALMKKAQELLGEPNPELEKVQWLLTAHRKLTADVDLLNMACFGDGGTPKDGWERHTRELETMGHRAELALLQAEGKDTARKRDALRKSNERLAREVQEGTQEALGITARIVVQKAKDTAEERARRAKKAAATRADTKDSRERDAAQERELAADTRAQEPKRGLVPYQRAVRERTCHKAVWDDVLPLVLQASDEVYTGDLFEDYRVIVSPPDVRPRVWLGVTGASRLEGCALVSFKLLEFAKAQLLKRHTLQKHKEAFAENEECLRMELDVDALRPQWDVSMRSNEVHAQVARDFAAFAGVLVSAKIGRYTRTFQFVTEPEMKDGILRFWIGHNYAELLRRGDGHGNYRNPQIVTYPNRIYATRTKAEFLMLQALCRAQDTRRRAAGTNRSRTATRYARSQVSLLIHHIGARSGMDWEREREERRTKSHKTWREMAQAPFEGTIKRLLGCGFLDFARYVADDGHCHKAEFPLGTRFRRASLFDGALLEFSVSYVPTQLAAFMREKRRRAKRTDKAQEALTFEGA